MNAPLIIEKLCKSYHGRRVLDEVSFAVPAGSVFGLLGPNGAGKTTLFSIVANFIHAETGSVTVLGHPHQDVRALHGRLGILPQDAAFQRDLSILDQFVYFLRLAGRTHADAVAEVAEALSKVGLSDYLGRRTGELSHGMYKRLCLAQAFMGEPEVILLDEPTAGLDPKNAAMVRALIRELAKNRAAVVVSSHDLAEMQELCSHVAILKQGRLASCGPVGELLRATTAIRLLPARPLTDAERSALATVSGVTAVEPAADGWIELRIAGEPAATALAVQAKIAELGILVRRFEDGGTLERHFLAVTADKPPV